MKISKILYFAALSAGLFFSSCSMNKEAANTSYLQAGKLKAEQQLAIRNSNSSQSANLVISPQANQVATSSIVPTVDHLSKAISPAVQCHSKTFAGSNFMKKTGKSLAQTITLPKVIGTINKLIKKPAFTASSKANPFAGMNYLVMWIICLVLAIVFLALAYFPVIGLLFDILGIIASIFFIIFLILWILQMMQG